MYTYEYRVVECSATVFDECGIPAQHPLQLHPLTTQTVHNTFLISVIFILVLII